jgi:asparagine synthase (glutamine-hydrolysing)
MCGIFAFFGQVDIPILMEWFNKIRHRGPDNTHTLITDNIFFGFHRLSIIGLNSISDQPMTIEDVTLCCNGEIYNYKELAERHEFKLQTYSDCEIIIHLYQRFGIEKTCRMVDGEFSFLLYDHKQKVLFAGRDLLGLRGLFYGTSEDKSFAFASEAKALGFCDSVISVPPRTYWSSLTKEFASYYEFVPKIIIRCEEEICQLIVKIFSQSVQKRVQMSHRPVGFLLSGGLDSSLCTALGVKCFDDPRQVHTFSIGLTGSPDLKYAQIVADYLGTTHHSIEYSEKEFLDELPETIRVVESFDVTTVRASNGHRLIAKYILNNTDIKVVISGEVSDELTCGYMAFGAISNPQDLLEESLVMLNNIHLYDTLRSDRSISGNGLEGRYPFAATEFLELYLSIPPEMKTFHNKSRIEKYLLRKAFADKGLLPESVLWRRKDGFSDGISATTRSTNIIIGEFVNTQISDNEYELEKEKYEHLKPETKEELYYREIFDLLYPNRGNLIPKPWRPNPKFYGKVLEPSGRILDSF